MNSISITDLMALNRVAKSLKCTDFMFIRNMIVSISNIEYYVAYAIVEGINDFGMNIILNARELSAFLKTVTTETCVEYDMYNPVNVITSALGAQLTIKIDPALYRLVEYKLRYVNNTDFQNSMYYDITDTLTEFASMSKKDGAFYFSYTHPATNKKYFMTIFSSLIPLNKGDKIFVRIYDCIIDNTFVANFKICKKNKDIVNIYVEYLKV